MLSSRCSVPALRCCIMDVLGIYNPSSLPPFPPGSRLLSNFPVLFSWLSPFQLPLRKHVSQSNPSWRIQSKPARRSSFFFRCCPHLPFRRLVYENAAFFLAPKRRRKKNSWREFLKCKSLLTCCIEYKLGASRLLVATARCFFLSEQYPNEPRIRRNLKKFDKKRMGAACRRIRWEKTSLQA